MKRCSEHKGHYVPKKDRDQDKGKDDGDTNIGTWNEYFLGHDKVDEFQIGEMFLFLYEGIQDPFHLVFQTNFFQNKLFLYTQFFFHLTIQSS